VWEEDTTDTTNENILALPKTLNSFLLHFNKIKI